MSDLERALPVSDFADDPRAVESTLIGSHVDADGRTWLLLEERRLCFVLLTDDDDGVADAHDGSELFVRLDVVEGRGA